MQKAKTGTCPWCGKKGKALYKTTALIPLKTESEDMTVVSAYVCATCINDRKSERRWLKKECEKAGVMYRG